MAITPTSTKSKAYQALGIDEIANDIETVFTAVNDLETTVGNLETEVNNLPASPTTTVVNISSAQILAMGSSPIELLPAAGSGKYYDIEKIILEYTHVTAAYNSANDFKVISSVNFWDLGYLIKDVITNADDNIGFVDLNDYNNTMGIVNLNEGVKITCQGGTDPTLGDGTLRAIITYTTRTFGA